VVAQNTQLTCHRMNGLPEVLCKAMAMTYW
jgi:hypothetical protein